MIINKIEYTIPGGAGEILVETDAEYIRIGKRTSDKSVCFYYRARSAKRQSSIAVGHILSLVVDGVNYDLVTPALSNLTRAQEIAMLCGQDFAEHGASAYYDPRSPKYHRYSELEKMALASLSTDSTFISLPAVSEIGAEFDLFYRQLDGNMSEEHVQPLSVLGHYDFQTKIFNAIDVHVRWPATGDEGPLTALSIISVRSQKRGLFGAKSISATEWVNSLKIDSTDIDTLVELRKGFRARFGTR
jgi:hypothetical protein